MATINLLQPHKAQMEILNDSARFNIIASGRRFGKSELAKIIVCRLSIMGEQVFWFSPTYQMSSQIWRELKEMLLPITKSKNEQGKMLLLNTGGEIRVFSAESYNSIRGLSPKAVIVDEAAMIAELSDMWNAAILPALADKKGQAYFFSTPKGENYFSELFSMGQKI